MDVDISDILASVSRRPGGVGGAASHSHPQGDFGSDTDAFTDHQLLTRAWTAERCAPDLLPWPEGLIGRVMERLQRQIERIEDLAGGGDRTSHNSSGNQNANLILSILQTDLSRTQFIIRSLLRQRLAKISTHAVYYLSRTDESDDKTLSPAELQFLRHHQSLLSNFYESSFLDAFPAALKRLDDSSGGVPMVEPPDGGAAVVVRCLAEQGPWTNERDVEDAAASRETDALVQSTTATVELTMRRGEVWVVRWRDVRRGVERGDLELL
jgi:GINS complex subunit 4